MAGLNPDGRMHSQHTHTQSMHIRVHQTEVVTTMSGSLQVGSTKIID